MPARISTFLVDQARERSIHSLFVLRSPVLRKRPARWILIEYGRESAPSMPRRPRTPSRILLPSPSGAATALSTSAASTQNPSIRKGSRGLSVEGSGSGRIPPVGSSGERSKR
jgi:hypothetical protein